MKTKEKTRFYLMFRDEHIATKYLTEDELVGYSEILADMGMDQDFVNADEYDKQYEDPEDITAEKLKGHPKSFLKL